MGFKKTVKSAIKQIADSIHSFLNQFQQQTIVESNHYESVTKQLNEIDQKTAASLHHITEQINYLNDLIGQENASASNDEISPAVLSLSEELRTRLENTAQMIDNVREMIASSPKSEVSSSELFEQLQKISTSVSRHNTVIEDLIESMEDAQEEQKNTLAEMKKIINQEEKAEIASLKSSENALLNLVEVYQDQIHILELAARSDPSWTHQFYLVRQKLTSQLQSAGITVIDQVNVAVNYDLHDVIERIDTSDPNLNYCVSDVFKCGYLFNGIVHRKAQVSVFVLSQQTEHNTIPETDETVQPEITEASTVESDKAEIDFVDSDTASVEAAETFIPVETDTEPVNAADACTPEVVPVDSDTASVEAAETFIPVDSDTEPVDAAETCTPEAVPVDADTETTGTPEADAEETEEQLVSALSESAEKGPVFRDDDENDFEDNDTFPSSSASNHPSQNVIPFKTRLQNSWD